MLKAKNIFKKETLVEVGGLAVGSVTAEIVNKQVTPKVLPANLDKFAPAVPILVGALFSTSAKRLTKTIGYGMMANGITTYANDLIPMGVKKTVGIDGVDPNILMSGVDAPLMSGIGAMDSGFDYSATPGGEMDY